MKNFTLSILFLCVTFNLYAFQYQEDQKIDSIKALSFPKELKETIINSFNTSNEANIKAFKELLYTYKSTKKKLLQNKKTLPNNLDESIGFINYKLIEAFRNTGQIDSVIKYGEFLEKATLSPYFKALSQMDLSWAKEQKKYYGQALESLIKSKDYFKSSKLEIAQYRAIQTLFAIINYNLRYSDLSTVDDFLKETEKVIYENKTLQEYEELNALFKIFKAKYYTREEKYTEALEFLNSVDENKFSNNIIILFTLYNDYLNYYINTKNPDMALKYYTKIFNENLFTPLVSNPYYKISSSLKRVNIYLLKEEYQKGLAIFNTLPKDVFKIPTPSQANYLSIKSKLYTKLGLYKIANEALLLQVQINDSINNINAQAKIAISNYNLKNDIQLQRVKEQNNLKEQKLISENKAFNLKLFALIIIASLLFIVFYLLLNKKRNNLNVKLNASKKIIAEKNAFLENISHEVRTPIGIISGYLMMIKEIELIPKKAKYFANNSINIGENLIEKLNYFLTQQKIENHHFKSELSKKNTVTFFNNIIKNQAIVGQSKEITVFFKTNISKKAELDFDYQNLEIILNNLISNALKYSNSKSEVYVSVLLAENFMTIKIKDSGIGIAKEDQKLIFSKFYQANNNKKVGGFGIGLSLVKQLAEKLKGNIVVESELNVGSIFTLTLPLNDKNYDLYVKEEKSTFIKIITNDDDMKHNISDANMPKALIVDDNMDMISFYKELLAPILQCTFTFNGKEAIEIASKNQFDIVISDARMPLMDGFTLKAELNKLYDTDDFPFILITALNDEYVSEKSINLSLTEYFQKPFDNKELIYRISKLLERNIYRKNIENESENKINFKTSYTSLIEKINTIIIENLDNNDFKVSDLAKKCNLSELKLNEILKSKLGLNIQDVIIEVRLLKAYEYIKTNKFSSIMEVIYAIGLNSRSYFNKRFEQRFGIKPGQLKKKYS